MKIIKKKVRLTLDFLFLIPIVITMDNNEIEKVIDHLTQASYNANRNLGESPERLALVFGKKEVALMEAKFQKRLTIAQK